MKVTIVPTYKNTRELKQCQADKAMTWQLLKNSITLIALISVLAYL